MTVTPGVLDLDAAREQRARLRASRQEGRGDTLPIRFGGKQIAELGAEFPLDVLEPLQHVNLDLALLIRQAIDLTAAENQDAQMATLDTIVSVLASNPDLPREVIDAVKEMGRRLLTEEGYAQFIAQRPTPWDMGALVSHLLSWYGVNLGDFSSPSTPSTGGATSKPISDITTNSTSAPSGDGQTSPGSLASATSPI
jgi:hypothetical protein